MVLVLIAVLSVFQAAGSWAIWGLTRSIWRSQGARLLGMDERLKVLEAEAIARARRGE